jgi:hypothetical protein
MTARMRRWAPWVIDVLTCWAIAVGAPLTISYDGHEYLRSGFAILDRQVLEHYQWIREPGYPLFAAVSVSLGGPRLLIFLQALMLLLAVRMQWLAANSLFQRAALRIKPIWPVIAVALVWGYATAVLQQAAILLGISTAMLGFARLRTGARTWPWLLAGSGIMLGLISAPVLLGLLAAAGVIVLLSLRGDLGRRSVVGFLVLLGVGTAVLAPWYAFKLSQDMSASDSPGARNFWEASNYQGFGLVDRIAAVPSTLLALSSGGIEFQQGLILAPGYENREYGVPQFSGAESCGRRQPYQSLPGFDGSVEQALQDCVATQPLSWISAADHVLGELLPLIALAGLASLIVVLAWVPRTRLDWTGRAILALPWISLGPYAWATGAISRYGLAALCLDVVLIGAAGQLAAMKWRAGSG